MFSRVNSFPRRSRSLTFPSAIPSIIPSSRQSWITSLILLPEKFLPFDCLRAEVFQLNLKYLHVKITVTIVTQNHQINSSHELGENGGKISRF